MFEEAEITETNAEINSLLPFFFSLLGTREIDHMKPDTVLCILISEQTELKL